MKRLFPPVDDVQLYEDGFGESDLLNRKPVGERLSDLLNWVEEPVVLALDGAWGSGKSHFLKRWVGAHQKENNGKATTVYFDAFANDFLEDPLIALTGEINGRLSKKLSKKKQKALTKVKIGATKLAGPFARMAAAVATAGATEIAGPMIDALIKTSATEVKDAADAFWRREDGRKAAMSEFRSALAELTQSSEEDEGQPLIIVIDELDRCRPDYALAVLEVIKHFFSVPHVHFVLGVNLSALEHIVRARYGAGVDAADYLKRFISLSMQLPEVTPDKKRSTQLAYFDHLANNMELNRTLISVTMNQLNLAIRPTQISLRDVEKILTRLALLPRNDSFEKIYHGWNLLIVSLVLFQVMKPEFFRSAVNGTLTIEDIDRFYGIRSEMVQDNAIADYKHDAYMIRGAWLFVLSKGMETEDDKYSFARLFSEFGNMMAHEVLEILPRIERDYFDLFEVPE